MPPVRYAPPVTEHVPLHSKQKNYLKIWHVRLGGANNMHRLSFGGWKRSEVSIEFEEGSIGVLLICFGHILDQNSHWLHNEYS